MDERIHMLLTMGAKIFALLSGFKMIHHFVISCFLGGLQHISGR
jgi:hypothetical protein